MTPKAVARCFVTLALLAPACGPPGRGSGGAAQPSVAVNVLVAFDRDVDPLPFDPRGERLRAALDQLARLAGHAVSFRFEAALLPEYRSSFETELIEAVERAAQGLRALHDRERPVFDRAAPLLERIECRYDATAAQDTASFDADRRVLVVTIHPGGDALLGEGLLVSALDDEYYSFLERRFGKAGPKSVSPREQAAYFEFLTGYRPHRPNQANLEDLAGYGSDPRAMDILAVAELYRIANGASLKSDIRRFLLSQGDYFTSAYVHHPALVESAAKTTAFHRAEAAWVGFVLQALPSMTDGERLTLAKTLFVRMFNDDEGRYGRFAAFAFPGLDSFAFALAVVEEWRRAGYPLETPGMPERGELYEYIVCPHPVDERGTRSRAPRCEYDLYEFALASPRAYERLVQAVLTLRDPRFTETVFVNFILKGRIDDVIRLFRSVEPDEATWRVAARVIAEELAETSGDPLIDESRRLWRTYPTRRGALLYILSQADRYGNGRVPWNALPQSFGSAASAADFASFLDQGYRALSTAAVVWPALAPGFSRAAPLAARLERYLDDPLVREYYPQDPWSALRNVVNRLCEEHRKDDVELLHARFVDRAQRKPSESRAWSNLIEDTGQAACR